MENTLYYGDNLHILRDYIPDNSIDLIYLDPPFNSKASYNLLFKEPTGIQSEAQITAFEDTWHWTKETERTFQEIVDTAPANLIEMMGAFRQFVGLNDVMAYLTMMCIRLLELKRVLKETGSIYLHCDPGASHYLKIVMDTVFGKECFRNEIVWCYSQGGKSSRHFGKKHDVILFYSKGNDYIFNDNKIRLPFTPHKQDKTGKSYGGRMGIDEHGREYVEKWGTGKKKLYRYYLDEGRILEDWWTDINSIQAGAHERLGYPTQKPISLLERIIKASAPLDGIILDPFCGCGTTISACEKLNHDKEYKLTWIGIDITHIAINLIKWRLNDMFKLKSKQDYKVIGEPEDLAGARELASQNRYQFQWWACSLIHARPYGDKKKGSDTGIDGYLYFKDDPDKPHKRAIVQVKSGHVSVKDIRDLGHVIDREQSEVGIFITLEKSTRPMETEAASKGFYRSPTWNKDFPKIQIFTIEELLSGKEPDVPHPMPAHKQAEKAETDKQKELDL